MTFQQAQEAFNSVGIPIAFEERSKEQITPSHLKPVAVRRQKDLSYTSTKHHPISQEDLTKLLAKVIELCEKQDYHAAAQNLIASQQEYLHRDEFHSQLAKVYSLWASGEENPLVRYTQEYWQKGLKEIKKMRHQEQKEQLFLEFIQKRLQIIERYFEHIDDSKDLQFLRESMAKAYDSILKQLRTLKISGFQDVVLAHKWNLLSRMNPLPKKLFNGSEGEWKTFIAAKLGHINRDEDNVLNDVFVGLMWERAILDDMQKFSLSVHKEREYQLRENKNLWRAIGILQEIQSMQKEGKLMRKFRSQILPLYTLFVLPQDRLETSLVQGLQKIDERAQLLSKEQADLHRLALFYFWSNSALLAQKSETYKNPGQAFSTIILFFEKAIPYLNNSMLPLEDVQSFVNPLIFFYLNNFIHHNGDAATLQNKEALRSPKKIIDIYSEYASCKT